MLAAASLVAALLGAALELLAGPGYRLGWWPLVAGIQTLRWAATVAAVAGVLGLIAAAWALRMRARGAFAAGAAALAIGVAAAGPPAYLYLYAKLRQLPRIHDIGTDTASPPAFVAVLPLRRAAPNATDYAPAVAAEQRNGYPDIAPLLLERTAPAQAFERARRAVRELGLEVVAEVPREGRIEATATSLLFGFKDDVVIRITPQGAGSRVDVRSLSRVGISDFGANAARVRALLQRMLT